MYSTSEILQGILDSCLRARLRGWSGRRIKKLAALATPEGIRKIQERLAKSKDDLEESTLGVDSGAFLQVNRQDATGISRVKESRLVEGKLGCVYIPMPAKIARLCQALARQIDPADLAADGIEDEPHITVLYGVDGASTEEVREQLAGFGPVHLRLGKVGLFDNAETGKDCEVLLLEVESKDLHELHQHLAENLPVSLTHEYHPHLTLAYLKPGTGYKYTGLGLQGLELDTDEVVYSDSRRRKTTCPLLESWDPEKHHRDQSGRFSSGSGEQVDTDEDDDRDADDESDEEFWSEVDPKDATVVLHKVIGEIEGDYEATCTAANATVKAMYPKAERWQGTYNGEDHEWAKVGSTWIDVTASQFGGPDILVSNQLPAEYVGQKTDWSDLSILDARKANAFTKRARETRELHESYPTIGDLQEAAKRNKGEVWQGPSGRWFTVNQSGRVVPAKAPTAGEKKADGKKSEEKPEQSGKSKPATKAQKTDKVSPESIKGQIQTLLASGKTTSADAQELSKSLMQLTVAQIGELKKELGLKASGAKAELAKKVAERALQAAGVAGVAGVAGKSAKKAEKKPEKKPEKAEQPPPEKAAEKTPEKSDTPISHEKVIEVAARLVNPKDLRIAIPQLRKELGLSFEEFDRTLKTMRRENKIRLIPVGDRSRFPPAELYQGIEGENETFMTAELPDEYWEKNPPPEQEKTPEKKPEDKKEKKTPAKQPAKPVANSVEKASSRLKELVTELYADPLYTKEKIQADVEEALSGLSTDEIKKAALASGTMHKPLGSRKAYIDAYVAKISYGMSAAIRAGRELMGSSADGPDPATPDDLEPKEPDYASMPDPRQRIAAWRQHRQDLHNWDERQHAAKQFRLFKRSGTDDFGRVWVKGKLAGQKQKTVSPVVARAIQASPNAPVSMADLRKKSGLSKEEFDKQIWELIDQGNVYPVRHNHPGSLTPKEREQMLVDPQGGHYFGLAARDPGALKGLHESVQEETDQEMDAQSTLLAILEILGSTDDPDEREMALATLLADEDSLEESLQEEDQSIPDLIAEAEDPDLSEDEIDEQTEQ